jgi:FlaG/FlaF family flagellin (archaellin)
MINKDKRGLSVIVGYILLIVLVISMAAIVYSWLKTYVPKEDLKCPDEVSVFINGYECDSNTLNLTIKNDGNFNIGGYFIRASNVPDNEVATIDLSDKITSGETTLSPTGIKTLGNGNSFAPNDQETYRFDVSSINPKIYGIEIIPIRWQEDRRRERLVSCLDARIKKALECS